jgi:hypothetical protein
VGDAVKKVVMIDPEDGDEAIAKSFNVARAAI